MNSQPLLIIIGGPNGAGKTTLTNYLIQRGRLNTDITPIINPDNIALTLTIYNQTEKEFQAARIALDQRSAYLQAKQSFAIETTFSGNSEISLLKQAKEAGYIIIGYYVTLSNVQDSIFRVENRVVKGGHNVPTKNLLIRYKRSLQNLSDNFQKFDRLYLFDNSLNVRSRIAIIEFGKLTWINKKHQDHPLIKRLNISET